MKRGNHNWARISVGGSTKSDMEKRIKVLDGFNTPPIATRSLLKEVGLSRNLWEPAAGFHYIARVLSSSGHRVYTSDIHRWHRDTHTQRDFLKIRSLPPPFRERGCDIVTNPPFVLAQSFAEHSLRLLRPGGKLCMILRLQFLEGIARGEFFAECPPRYVIVFSFRLPRMHRFGYRGRLGGSAMAFAWFVWQKGYDGPTIIRWIRRRSSKTVKQRVVRKQDFADRLRELRKRP